MLAFAYASILYFCLGNVTFNTTGMDPSEKYNQMLLLDRSPLIYESPYEQNSANLNLRNSLGSLRFVSCGHKGLDDFAILLFLSVFDDNVWKWIVINIIVIS